MLGIITNLWMLEIVVRVGCSFKRFQKLLNGDLWLLQN